MHERLLQVPKIIDSYLPTLLAGKNMPKRAQTVSMKILLFYLDFVKKLSEALALKASDEEEAARVKFREFANYVGKFELEMERYYDQHACIYSYNRIFNNVRMLFDAE